MADEQRIHVEFFLHTEPDPAASRLAGHPKFKETEYARIRFVGDKNKEISAPAHEKTVRNNDMEGGWISYVDRFPEHYKAFKAGIVYHGDGTPIEEAPFLSMPQKAEMKALNIFTIENLADPPSKARQLLGASGRMLIDQASAWIENVKGNAPIAKLAAENSDLRDQMDAMKRQVAEIMASQAPRQSSAPSASPFDAYDDETLKVMIKDKTGSRPLGNPSHATLVRTLDELNEKVAA